MKYNIFKHSYLVFVIASITAYEDGRLVHQNKENILCRNCGSHLSSSRSIISKLSPKSGYSFSDTLFFKDDVLVQVFATGVFFHYPVILFKYASCVPAGEWEESTSWFPGYLWKPCVCPDCGAFVGFVFEPINPNLILGCDLWVRFMSFYITILLYCVVLSKS